MHLAYLLGTYPQPSETFIAREIAGLQARGHRVEVYSLFAPAEGPMPGVQYAWPTAAARALRKLGGRTTLVRRWRAAFATGGYDALVAHFGSLPSTVALEAAGDLPFLLSLHARDIYVEAERLAEKCARASAVVTCTRANLTYLHAQYPAAADRIHLVYHGLPRAWLDTPPPPRPRAAGDPLRLLAVGRLVVKKGYLPLLAACARLRDAGVPYTLRLIGDGPERAALEAQARQAGLAHVVYLAGWASQPVVREAYAWADVFCCPSIEAPDGDRDGLPNVLMEAMSTGLPTVGTNFSGIPEAIDDGLTGYLVPPGDVDALAAVLLRLTGAETRMTLGHAAARAMRERFDAERGLDVLEGLLRSATSQRT